MKKTRCFGLLMAGILLVSSLCSCGKSEDKEDAMRDITTMELVREMGVGINLGNTFESCGSWIDSSSVTNYETGWGSPVITKEMIQGYADCGFGVLRVPVAWSNRISEDNTIDTDYLARVKQVVDWALDTDMYVIVNIHWDGGWWEEFPTEKEACMAKYVRIWEQLADAFKSYGDHLMLESLNEEGCWDTVWNRYGGTDGKEEAFALLNEINQTFVNLIRDSGGNNLYRHLLIAGYATDIELTCDSLFVMPTDAKNRCAVSVHYYTPPTFCILEEDASWGKVQTEWGSQSDVAELERYMDMMKTNFVDKGVPVIIGEFGLTKKNKTDETIRNYLSSVTEAAYDREMCPVLWDITDVFYSRTTYQFIDPTLLQELMAVKE